MKKIVICLISILILFPVSITFAHVLKTDGDIGAVLHVNPEDDPIAGEPSGLFFEFKDRQDRFKIENCVCTFSVAENGKEIYSQALTDLNVFYTFPQKNIYKIKVSGKPIKDGDFQPFNLIYDVRVARESTNINVAQKTGQNWFTMYLNYIIVGSIIGMFLLAVSINQIKRR